MWNPLPAVATAAITQNTGATTGLLDVLGTGFVAGSQLQAAGVTATTTYVSATELQATIPIATGATSVTVDVVNPNPGGTASPTANAPVSNLKATLQASARLLDQATFGPTLTDIQNVETIGLQAYLNQQFALPATLEPDIATPPPTACATNTIPCQQSEWWQAAITAPDQLRQRVALRPQRDVRHLHQLGQCALRDAPTRTCWPATPSATSTPSCTTSRSRPAWAHTSTC